MSVVVTGVGVVSAAGRGLEALAELLRAGGSAARPAETALPVSRVAAVDLPLPQLADFPDDRKAALAFAAVDDALADARWLPGELAPERTGVFLGTGLSSVTPHELAEDIYPHLQADGTFDRDAIAADLRPEHVAPRRHMPARVAEALAVRLGARGPVATSFSACAAASQAIAEGYRALARGEVDRVVVGGHDSMLHPLGLLSFVVLGALSPDVARPFDRRRDGFLIGEAACMLVLEREADARARGVPPRARVLGAGSSADAWNVTAPHPEGLGAERAMRRALRDAGLRPEEIDYVNAHGTGTPVGDVAEAAAIGRVFGDRVPVSSTKGALGHTIAACGALEAAVCVAALEGGFLPGTAGLEEADPALEARVLAAPLDEAPLVVLSNSFGFGGQNGCLIFGRASA